MSYTKFRTILIGAIASLLVGVFSVQPALSADEVDVLLKKGKPKSARKGKMPRVYHFHQYLSEAEASIRIKKNKPVVGVWQQDRFTFQGFGQDARIRNEVHTYDGVSEEGIFIHPIKNAIRRLRFPNVPTGRFLILSYGIDDVGVEQGNKNSSVYIRIWIGKHHLERIIVSNEKGWKKKRINLGVLAFLKRHVPVTIEVNTDDTVGRRLSFKAEIHP